MKNNRTLARSFSAGDLILRFRQGHVGKLQENWEINPLSNSKIAASVRSTPDEVQVYDYSSTGLVIALASERRYNEAVLISNLVRTYEHRNHKSFCRRGNNA